MASNMPGALPSSASQHSNNSTSSKPPPISLEQSRQIARTHFDALKSWLHRQGALANASTRTNAREKLTRLTRQQFQELSTDVYDELMRRIEESTQPFLAVRPDFHPKRNQARQKLATLQLQRFKDLASDVYFELDRRYPEFNDESSSQQQSASYLPRSDSVSRSAPSGPPVSSAPVAMSSPAISPPPPTNLAQQRRAPTPLSSQNSSNDVVVPNKSTLVMENSGNSSNGPSPSASSPVKRESFSSSPGFAGLTKGAGQQQSGNTSGPNSPFSASGGGHQQMSSLGAVDEYEQEGPGYAAQGGPSARGHHIARASETSSVGTRFIGGYAGSSNDTTNGRSWDHEEKEKLKSEYEYKITMLQNRVSELERENEDASNALKNRSAEQSRQRDLEDQLRSHRERNDSQATDLQRLRAEFDDLNSSRSTGGGDRAATDDLANELRVEVSSLVDELRNVNAKYEDAVEGLERERQAREKVEDDARMWKKKYEQTKTELRNLKATSQLFSATIKVDSSNFMPASADGLLADVHISEFQTSIDDLLDAARSKEPSSVLPAARAIVAAVDKIDADVQMIDPRRLSALSLSDQDALTQTKNNIGATLSNLMTASKNHAMSFGVSPVSLVDAAASHLSMSVVELVKILKIRRTVGSSSASSAPSRGVGFEPMHSLSESPTSSTTAPPPPPAKQNGGLGSGSSWTGGMKSVLGNLGMNRQAAQQPSAPSTSDRDSREAGHLPSSSSTGSLAYNRSSPSVPTNDYGSASRGGNGYGSTNPEQQSWDQSQLQPQHPRGGSSSNDYRQQQPTSPGYGGSSYGRPTQHDDRFASPQTNAYDGREMHSPQSDYDYRRDSREPSGVPQQRGDGGAYGYNDHVENQPQPVERTLTYGSPDPRDTERSEDNADELKNYIENQTEAIVHSIQSLLGAIRGGAQGEQLNENLTQIITIVSSIVAISRDALPASSRREGEGILHDLAENCDKLSEMQSLAAGPNNSTAFNKQTKQSMASASFGVAKSLKQLNGLLASRDDEGLM